MNERPACFGSYEIDKAGARHCARCPDSMACASIDEARMDIIGSNGNEGLHYADPRSRQIGGDHYARLAVQPWDVMRATMAPVEFQAFLRGNVIKYVMRDKGNRLEDFKKAAHYLDTLIHEMESAP